VAQRHLHHAYLVEGAPEHGERFLYNLFEEIGFIKEQNPDFHEFRNSSFSVDEARLVHLRAQGKSFGNRKIFVISSTKFTLEAQNALLKTLEEPFENVHFFILLNARDLLLPTLLSRLEVVRPEDEGIHQNVALQVEEFLASSISERMAFIKKWEGSLPSFLDALLGFLQREQKYLEMKKVHVVRRYADDPAALPRLILEHLAVIL
jgi:DNA polymerase III delta prime subunit